MSGIPITEADLQAFVDGHLPDGKRAEVEAYLAEHPDEATRLDAYRAQCAQLRELFAPVLDERLPERLTKLARPWRVPLGRIAAAVAWMAIGAAIGWQLRVAVSPAPATSARAPIARNAAIAHATYTPEVRHPVEVGADQEAHLVAWLSKRLGAKVRAPNLDSVGYSLVGGRLLPSESGPVAQFMYQNKEGSRVTLYVRATAPDQEQTAFRYADEGGVRVFYWIDRTFGYAVSSNHLGKDALLKIANAAYAQLNP